MDEDWRKAQGEAADWLLLLEDEPEDAHLRQRFEQWLDEDPLHVRAWASVSTVFETMAGGAPLTQEQWNIQPSLPWRRIKHAWPRLAGLALAACLALAVLPWARLHWQADVITGAGEIRALHLPDGSFVRLGPQSAVTLVEHDGGRTVTLLAGRAWFEVKHDPAHPFRVVAGQVTATDIGTAFDVRRSRQDTAVDVAQGAVRVLDLGTAPATAREMHGGQWLRIASDHTLTQGLEAPGLIGAWRDGTIVLRNQTLAEAIDELRPWYAGRIVLTDAAFGQQRIDGAFDVRSPSAALDGLVLSRGGVVRHITPWLMVVSAR